MSPPKRTWIISLPIAIAIAAAIVIGFAVGNYLLRNDEQLMTAYGDIANSFINAAAALCLLFAAIFSRSLDRRLYIAWMMLALAQFIYVAGDVVFAYLEVGLNQSPFPSLADAFYVLYYPLFMLGILLLPTASLKSGERIKLLLDTGIVLVTAVLVFWALLIAPTMEASSEENTLTIVFSIAYPVGDLILLFALVELLFRKLSLLGRQTLGLLVASMAVMIFADAYYMYGNLEGTYESGNLLGNTSWILSFAILGLAAISHTNNIQKRVLTGSIETEQHYVQLTWPLYLPYICAAIAFLFLVLSHEDALSISFSTLAWTVGCIIGLVIIRQIIALRENAQLFNEAQQEIADRRLAELEVKRLNEELENRVLERTAQFEQANKELQAEIVERTQAEIALKASQQRLADIINFLPDATMVIDNDGKVIAWNKAIESLTGIKAENILGKGDYAYALPFYGERGPILIDHVHKPQKEIENKYYNIKRLDDGTLVGEAYMTHLNAGGTYLVESAAALYDYNGKVAGAIETILDITERKRFEQDLQKAKEAAESATKAKSEFLANMSHEIRTPMNAVIGMTWLLLGTNLTPEQRDYIETIRSSGDTLLGIINDILDFSKIEGGKMELEAVPFDLRICVEESLDLVAAKASEKKLELAYIMDERVPEWIDGDILKFRQILVNLLGNAVKFTEKGEIVVHIDVIAEDQNRVELHFAVADTGIGISKDNLGKLFQSFSQLDSSTTRNYGGTGLGLAISRRLVELMGGKIWVESKVGKGSTFHFTVKAAVTQPKYNPDVISTSIIAGKRILVVEDNNTIRSILLGILSSFGMRPIQVVSGNEALGAIKTDQSFDIILLDDELSDNVDTVALANELRWSLNIPIIIMSSLGRSKSHDLPNSDWLTKPIKPLQLKGVLDRLLSLDTASGISPERVQIDANDQSKTQSLRILLAEDNPVNQKVALAMLKRLGYDPDVANNGIEVLYALGQQPYDVVLMDVQMPQMDGLEATRCIRKEGFGTWIIAMTAYALDGDRDTCINIGMNDYISKPIKMNELRDALERRAAMLRQEGS